jgi:hypothetical protein
MRARFLEVLLELRRASGLPDALVFAMSNISELSPTEPPASSMVRWLLFPGPELLDEVLLARQLLVHLEVVGARPVHFLHLMGLRIRRMTLPSRGSAMKR